MRVTPAAVLLGAILVTAPAGAQAWRTIEVSRQLHDTAARRVSVEYSAGKLTVRAAEAPFLYQMWLRYDEARGDPVHRSDDDGRTLHLGLRRESSGVSFRRRGEEGEMRLALTKEAPLDLSFDMGAAQADLDLTGLALSDLRVRSGASETTLRIGAPNPVPMRALQIDVGAAALHATGLANANTGEVRVAGGVGGVELSFDGEWTRDIEASANVALGGLTVRVPSDVGVRVEVGKVLASFEHDGLVKRGDAYYSPNWDSATRHLRLKAETVFGKLEVEQMAR